jgi:hypothetical protein
MRGSIGRCRWCLARQEACRFCRSPPVMLGMVNHSRLRRLRPSPKLKPCRRWPERARPSSAPRCGRSHPAGGRRGRQPCDRPGTRDLGPVRSCGPVVGPLSGTRPRRPRRWPAVGPPRDLWPEIRKRDLATTLTPPEAATHWSTRRLAKAVGVSPNTILRIWREGRLKPHRTETVKFSRDPELW